MNASIQRIREKIHKCSIHIYQPKTEIPTSINKIDASSVKLPLISWLFIMSFNSGKWSHYQMYMLRIVLIIGQSPSWFMKKNGCPCIILKEIGIISVPMIISSITDHVLNTSTLRKRNKYYSVLVPKCFCEKKLTLI